MAVEYDVSEETVRRPRVRGTTVSINRLSKRELERGRIENPSVDVNRPKTRGDCEPGGINADRPCPFVSCKYHLYLGVNPRSGAIKTNFPHLEVWEMSETCVLDAAARDGLTLEEVGARMNLTRERIRQIETRTIAALRTLDEVALWVDRDDDAEQETRVPNEARDTASLSSDLATTRLAQRLVYAADIQDALDGEL